MFFLGGGVCKNQLFFRTLLTFWPDFYYFHGDFWQSKNVDVYSLGDGGGGLRKCMVCTLVKMLTFMDGPLMLLVIKYSQVNSFLIIFFFFQMYIADFK